MLEKTSSALKSIYAKAVLLIILALILIVLTATRKDDEFSYIDFKVNNKLDQTSTIQEVLITSNGIKFQTDVQMENKSCFLMNGQGTVYEKGTSCLLPITSKLGYIITPEDVNDFYLVIEPFDYDKGDLLEMDLLDIKKMEYDSEGYEIFKINKSSLEKNQSKLLLNEPIKLEELKKQVTNQHDEYIKSKRYEYIEKIGTIEKGIGNLENQIRVQSDNYKNDKSLSKQQKEDIIYSINNVKKQLEIAKVDLKRFDSIRKLLK